MALTAGTCLGPYEILAPIGTGGQGLVHRALNSKLKPDDELEGEGEEVSMQTWLSRSAPVLSPNRQVRIARGVAHCAQIAVGRVRRPT